MIRLETINFFILVITGLIAYIPTVTLSGFFSAWMADKLGDDTAKEEGYLTLNPYYHIDPFYMVATLLFLPYLGFTKALPINPNNIYARSFRNLKKLTLFFVDSVGYLIVLAIASIVMKIFTISFLNLTHLSAFNIVVLRFFKMIFGLTIFFILINFFWSVARAFIYFYFPELENSSYYFVWISLISIALIFLFGHYIEYFILLYKFGVDKLFNYLFL